MPWQSGRRDQVLGCSLISRGMRAGSGPRHRCCPLYRCGESYLGSSLVDVFTPPLRVVVVVAAPVNNKLRKNCHSSGAEIPWSKCYSNSLCKESIMIFNSKSKLVLFKISVLDKSKRRHTIPLTSTEWGAACCMIVGVCQNIIRYKILLVENIPVKCQQLMRKAERWTT